MLMFTGIKQLLEYSVAGAALKHRRGFPFSAVDVMKEVVSAAAEKSNLRVLKVIGAALSVTAAVAQGSSPLVSDPLINGHVYTIQSLNSDKVLDVLRAQTAAGATVGQWDNLNRPNQQWGAYQVMPGVWKFINMNSDMALGFNKGASSAVQLPDATSDSNMQWTLFTNVDKTAYYLNNANSHKMMAVAVNSSDTTVKGMDPDETAAQQWVFEDVSWPAPVSGHTYSIRNVSSGDCLNTSVKADASNDYWIARDIGNGVYRLVNVQSGGGLQRVGNSTAIGTGTSGADIGQGWVAERCGNNSFKLMNQGSNLFLGWNAKTSAFSLSARTPGAAQQWDFDDVGVVNGHTYSIESEYSGNVVEVPNSASNVAASQAEMKPLHSQHWTATFVGNGFYKFTNEGSRKVLKASANETVIQGDDDGSDAQKWRVQSAGAHTHFLINKLTGKVLDTGVNCSAAGSKLIQKQFMGSINQEWAFVEEYDLPDVHSNAKQLPAIGAN